MSDHATSFPRRLRALLRAALARAPRLHSFVRRAAKLGRQTLRRGRESDAVRAASQEAFAYQAWIERFDFLPERDGAECVKSLSALKAPPLISVVMPVHDTVPEYLDAAIRSVQAQIYQKWELCIADDASSSSEVRRILEEYRAADPRIRVVYRPVNGHISEATNSAFALARGEYVAMLDHDDVLREHALAEVALALETRPGAHVVYSDEDKIDEAGRRFAPYFKPDFSPDLLLAQNYFNHLTVCRTDAIREVGGWRKGFEGAQDHDLILRVTEQCDPADVIHIPKILYHWRAGAASTASATSAKNYAPEAGLRAIADHLRRTRPGARVEAIPQLPFFRVIHPLPEPAPLVSLIVGTRKKRHLVRGCVASILAKTAYPRFEVLVVHHCSGTAGRITHLAQLAAHPAVRVLSYPGPFDSSAITNFGARHARGTILGLIDEDVEVIDADWLREMVSHACRPEVGCVGAKLYTPDETVQHGGLLLGVGAVAQPAHLHAPRWSPGYFGRLAVHHNVTAVTAACLLVRREVFERIGGLEEELGRPFSDVDFCLKVRRLGLLNVWTPFAELHRHGALGPGTSDASARGSEVEGNIRTMVQRWGPELATDPYYSVNLSRERPDFSFRVGYDPASLAPQWGRVR
jgi:glycosyltransferase involved in cell wall biosynthesis